MTFDKYKHFFAGLRRWNRYDLGLKTIRGWTMHEEDQMGTFRWDNPNESFSIYATPFWDGEDGIQIEKVNDEGGCARGPLLKIGVSLILDYDVKEYFKVMNGYLKRYDIPKMTPPQQKMERVQLFVDKMNDEFVGLGDIFEDLEPKAIEDLKLSYERFKQDLRLALFKTASMNGG